MKTHISEVFSSIQGEGKLLGRRQIFIRFSGCNLNCNYCDTLESRNPLHGEYISTEELEKEVRNLITPDLHSLALTGGEPLLHADFIREFLENTSFDALIETNGSLPDELKKILDLIKYASVDIKLPEHDAYSDWNYLVNNELKSINLLYQILYKELHVFFYIQHDNKLFLFLFPFYILLFTFNLYNILNSRIMH